MLAEKGMLDQAEVFLRIALQDDKSRTGAHFLLAQVQAAKGLLNEARKHLVSASEAAPSWYAIIDKLAQLHARLGDEAEAHACRVRCDEQHMQTERLVRQLGLGLPAHTI